jgi:peptidyl-prolyl cis-trans isomerase D
MCLAAPFSPRPAPLALILPPPYHLRLFSYNPWEVLMIQWMHRLSKSWVASLMMGGLALSFVVWGIADVFTGQSAGALATVGSTEISSASFARTYRNFLRNQGQQMGMELTPELAQKMGLDRAALQQVIDRTALDNSAARFGLTTPDAELAQQVRALPAFKGATGDFDHNVFLQAVQGAGYTEQAFLEEMRSDQARGQLITALEAGFSLPDGYTQGLFRYVTEQRATDYVIVSPEAMGAIAPPTDAVLAGYIKAHPEHFSTPEYREIAYASVTPADVTSQVVVTDKMIADEFKGHEASYNVPEKRDVEQIEFPAEADAKAAQAKIAAGTAFEAVATERKISAANLLLGTLSKAEIPDEARADAIFALPLNQVSQPVKGAINGYVLLRVTKITPGIARTLDDSKAQIREQLALQMAGAKITDILNAYEDARSGGADLAAAAKKAGLKLGHIASVDKAGLSPTGEKLADLPADPEFLATAFTAEVGEDNDPVAAKSGAYYALKVNGVTPAKLKPLNDVRADALAAWAVEEKSKALAVKAVALAAQAQKDGNLTAVAKELKVPVQQSPALSRNTNDTTFSAGLITKLFDSAPGAIVQAPQGTGGNYIIARVTGVVHPQNIGTAQMYAAGRGQISQQAAADLSSALANASRTQQGVKVNQKLLQQVTGGAS